MFKIVSNHSNPRLVIAGHKLRIYVTVVVKDTRDGEQFVAEVPYLLSFKYKPGKFLWECGVSFPILEGKN